MATRKLFSVLAFFASLPSIANAQNPPATQQPPTPELMASIADILVSAPKRPLTTQFSPSIRLKSFDRDLSAFVAKKAGPEFNPGLPTNAACGMQRFQMKLSKEDGTPANEFAVLLDPQPSATTAKPGYLVARTEVLHVDSDGSPRSYHPDDPLGSKQCKLTPGPTGGFVSDRACAMDVFGDAEIHVFHDDQELKSAKLAAAWTKLWPKIRDGLVKPLDPQLIPDKLKNYYGFHDSVESVTAMFKSDIVLPTADRMPCVRQTASRFPGYFIAGTALSNKVDVPGTDTADAVKIAPKECQALRWVDASTVPFFVLPGSPFGDIGLGDIVAIYANIKGEDRLVFAVIGDSGPTGNFGEASVAALQLLTNKSLLPVMNNSDLNTWDIHGNLAVTVLLLGNTRQMVGDSYTRDSIESAGKQALAKWGGDPRNILQRLKACSSQAPVNKGS